ncbi:hypothetical protein ACSNOI_07530 [Actinomadura kijaniata]|uniref:hypothetical protein n=1 Tax=Actinomadura kijaniata TaxID=46161 RepID=UPI003F1D39AC
MSVVVASVTWTRRWRPGTSATQNASATTVTGARTAVRRVPNVTSGAAGPSRWPHASDHPSRAPPPRTAARSGRAPNTSASTTSNSPPGST